MKSISPPVLYYHSISPEVPAGWKLHDELIMKLHFFEDQLNFLKSSHYRTIFLDEWYACRSGQKESDQKSVVLTIDDGYLDNWVYAFPVAKKYGIKLTIFVSPECVDPRELVRPTLEDVWGGNCRAEDLESLGYLTWQELALMQASGLVDIQSHTMSHLKYPSSGKLKGFYYGGSDGIYPILAAYPAYKPVYMALPGFADLLPKGAPLFEESSAVITKIHYINPSLQAELKTLSAQFDLSSHDQRSAYEKQAMKIYANYERTNQVVTHLESEEDFQARLLYEVRDSKTIIEEKLKKAVRFLCWPHGDNSEAAHQLAKACGYLATTSGKLQSEAGKTDRIPRIGFSTFRNNRWLSRQKFHYKIASHNKRQPFYTLALVNDLKNRILK